jgi:hypothetical protein
MTDQFRGLCAEVLAYNNGDKPYNFSGLNQQDRENAAFDAWQDIRQRIKEALSDTSTAPPPVDLSHLSDDEFNALCPRGYHATGGEPKQCPLTDEQIMELMPQHVRDDLATASRALADQAGVEVSAGVFRVILNTGAVNFVHAVLEHLGYQVPEVQNDD